MCIRDRYYVHVPVVLRSTSLNTLCPLQRIVSQHQTCHPQHRFCSIPHLTVSTQHCSVLCSSAAIATVQCVHVYRLWNRNIIRRTYNVAIPCPDQPVEFKIRLDIPLEGTTLKEWWKLTPPVVSVHVSICISYTISVTEIVYDIQMNTMYISFNRDSVEWDVHCTWFSWSYR